MEEEKNIIESGQNSDTPNESEDNGNQKMVFINEEGIGKIGLRPIEDEMKESYLDYAMSVIVSRALPDVRDGLKPVHRRVLYSMHEIGLRSTAKYRKSAAVVGDVLGKYHPHGDMAVYDTMVRMAQSFSMRYPLIDGQGNFGSMDGDTAAAPRYTEARMAGISDELLVDIEKETIEWRDNYDSTRKEPAVLPAKLPNLLLNGTLGIAVGMATNIPPHNLGEIVDGIIHLINNPDCSNEDLVHFVKGPDFPTKGIIYNEKDILQAYTTGKGRIMIRSRAEIQEVKSGYRILVTELPYQVNKAELISKIADLVKQKKIEGITDLRDESDRNESVRIVIELKGNSYPKKVLNQLFEMTQMQTAFHVNMIALVNGIEPRVLTLKSILQEYVKHRQIVITKRTEYDLNKAKERAHILEGLLLALDKIDAIIDTIRSSANRDEAKKNLITKFSLSEMQSDAILDMRLSALAALEREKVKAEYEEKEKLIEYLEDILTNPGKILILIKDEILDLKKKFSDERRTEIVPTAIGDFTALDLIPDESVVITITKSNYIKRVPIDTYRSQIRGGKGILAMGTKEEDTVERMIIANTHDDIYFFSKSGKIFKTKVYELPAGSRQAKGQALVNVIQVSQDDKITAAFTLSSEEAKLKQFFFFSTAKGIVKKTLIDAYKNVRKTGILAINLNQGDKLQWVETTTGNDEIVQVCSNGQSIHYHEKDCRPLGRSAAGVRGINIKGNGEVVGLGVFSDEDLTKNPCIITVMENGFGKRTRLNEFTIQKRGGMGIKAANVTTKTGLIMSMLTTLDDKGDLMIISAQGQMIRIPMTSVKRLGRDTQGVTLIKLEKNDKVSSVSIVEEEKDE